MTQYQAAATSNAAEWFIMLHHEQLIKDPKIKITKMVKNDSH